jgi:hypothetical protein
VHGMMILGERNSSSPQRLSVYCSSHTELRTGSFSREWRISPLTHDPPAVL